MIYDDQLTEFLHLSLLYPVHPKALAMRRALLINSGLPVLFLLTTWMYTQQPAPQNNPQEQDQEPVTTLRKDVNVVNIFFNVKDKHAAIIPNLTKADFELYEDGKPQTIKYYRKETD